MHQKKPRSIAGTIVGVHSLENGERSGSRSFSYPNYEDLRAAAGPFTQLAAHGLAMAGVTDGDTTRRVMVDIVSANYFDTFGVALATGRMFRMAGPCPLRPCSSAMSASASGASPGGL